MQLSVEEVRKIARLARLRLSPEEEQTFVPQLRQIIDYFDQLSAVEMGVEGDVSATPTLEAEDVPVASLDRQTFLENAPQVRVPFLLVPQVKVTGDD
jgi:aspartyl-tRNA(Asn)/glutamyl-tRNA(Gln) amidotransferase subunit C